MNEDRGMGMLALGLVWLAMGVGCAYAADGDEKTEVTEIPLDQIWALDMPGTRDVKELDRVLVKETQQAIGHATPGNLETRAAFAVPGTGELALRAAHSVFTKKAFTEKNKSRKNFPADCNVSVVFFSAESMSYVHLDRVERQNKVINIYYRFVTNESKWTFKPPQLALIPLGKLADGKYRVNVIESPLEKKLGDAMFPSSYVDTLRIVGNSFSFFVGRQPVSQRPNEKGGEIYLDEIWTNGMPGSRNIGELQVGKRPTKEGRLLDLIHRSLSKTLPKGKEAKAGFAVLGSAWDALRESHAVLVEEKKPRKVFSEGDGISVVFFSYATGNYVYIPRVVRFRNTITIRYSFVSCQASSITNRIALIPLGKLSAGEYRVNIVRAPMGQRWIVVGSHPASEADARRVVCGSFSFLVEM